MIDNNQITTIINSANIVSIIGEYYPLKKAGKNFKILCPFHKEKTPSFVISPDKQIYHCFGCGAGGNVLSFIRQHENLGFIDAVKLLAKKLGINIEYKSGSGEDYNLYYRTVL